MKIKTILPDVGKDAVDGALDPLEFVIDGLKKINKVKKAQGFNNWFKLCVPLLRDKEWPFTKSK